MSQEPPSQGDPGKLKNEVCAGGLSTWFVCKGFQPVKESTGAVADPELRVARANRITTHSYRNMVERGTQCCALVIPVLRSLRQENYESEASQSYIVRPSPTKQIN